MNKRLIKISRFLCFVLRHKPESIQLALDTGGWANVEQLVRQSNVYKNDLTIEEIEEIVKLDDKQRFSLSDDGTLIRTSQGHSLNVRLELTPQSPPDILIHGTATRFLESIKSEGLLKMKRHHVHLSDCRNVARDVGSRYGKPLLLEINTKLMRKEGYDFFLSENGVWLVSHVPPSYIQNFNL